MKSVARGVRLGAQGLGDYLHHLQRNCSPNGPFPCAFSVRKLSSNAAQPNASPLRVAVIGSGPAGFYAAKRMLSLADDAVIDMYEQLPAPYGLVRYGVAPDHPEVKNCQDTFVEVAESPRFNFVGNVQIGKQLPIQYLLPHYNALLFAYGASQDRELGLEGERQGKHIHSARAFVGWYNGLPEYHDLNPDLQAGEDAVIIGQGNVALDVARTLLTDIDVLSKTDMTEYALDKIARSKIKNVRIVGRRGPAQAAFTIKEVREMLQLPGTFFNPIPDSLFPPALKSLPRPQRRLLELLKKGRPMPKTTATNSWSLDFLLSPHSLHYCDASRTRLSHITFTSNQLADPKSPASPLLSPSPGTEPTYTDIPASTLFRSIGYKSTPLPTLSDAGIPFDTAKGIFPNDGLGRVVSAPPRARKPSEMTHPFGVPIPGLYCAGWVKRGPTGVIASTMADAFCSAEVIVEDWKERKQVGGNDVLDKRFIGSEASRGWDGVESLAKSEGINLRRVSWTDWKKIDAVERDKGRMNGGKPREKISRVEEMLAVLD